MKKFIMFFILLFVGFSSSAWSQEHSTSPRQALEKYPIPQDQLKMLIDKYTSLKQEYGKHLGYGIGHCIYAQGSSDTQMKLFAQKYAEDSLDKMLDKHDADWTTGGNTIFVRDIHGGWYAFVYGEMNTD